MNWERGLKRLYLIVGVVLSLLFAVFAFMADSGHYQSSGRSGHFVHEQFGVPTEGWVALIVVIWILRLFIFRLVKWLMAGFRKDQVG